MSAKSLTVEDAQAANLVLVGPEKGRQAVHDLVTAYRANRRSGSANTKTRGEVRGNNKKIYKQKGTGNARHGDKRAPIFVGGGVVFGPRPRDYSKKVNKTTKRIALRKALSERIKSGDVLVVESFSVKQPKTKQFVAAVRSITEEPKTLIVSSVFDENTYLAGRNVQPTQLITAAEVNTEQLLKYKKIVVTPDALAQIAQRLAKK
jgi:large subunit ribosomal protein L4